MLDSWASLARTPKTRPTTVFLTIAIVLTAFAGMLTLPSPASSQGILPTATIAPEGIATPTPTSTPAVLPDIASGEEGEGQAKGLFFEIEGDPPSSSDVETLASRFAGIDFGQLDPSLESVSRPLGIDEVKRLAPRTVALNLFEDATFTGKIEHVEPTASGYAFWGGLDRVELGTMTMVVNGDIVVGTVRTPDAVYTIRTAESGSYVIREIDESTLPPLAEPLEAPPDSDEDLRQALDESVPLDDGSEIDLMVLYTPAARSLEGGRAGIEALIDLYVAQTNQAYANSGAFHRLRLVLKEEVDYVESGETLTDIQRLEDDSDGYMDHIHDLRDTYAADLAHLIFARNDEAEVAGRAYFEGPFGVTLAAPWGGLIFAHELGHNMGLLHDRYQIAKETEETIEGWHYGYVNQRAFEPGAPESALWRTIMSYNSQCREILGEYCPRLAYYSNPGLTYSGDPMGVSADNPSTGVDGPADAVRTLNERREITANFRRLASSTPRASLALSRYRLSEKGGISAVTATLHRPSSENTTVTISVSPDDAVTLSKNRTLTIPAGQTVSVGVVTVTAVDNDEQTGSVEVTVSATATNASTEGVVAPRSVTLYVIDDDADVEPVFVIGSVAYTFTAGEEDSRTLPEATGGNEPLTYSLSPEPDNGVTFVSGPPARIEVSTASVASDETSHTLTVTDSDGDTDSLALSVTVRSPGCDGSSAVSGYSGAGIVADCETLLASRDVLRGEQSLNWNMDLPIDDWEGVEIRSDRVFGIDLREGELSGSLPAELGNLTDLNYLWLAGNELSGPIPPELGNLSKLWSLWITNNNLSGPIPPELGKLTDLRYLSIGLNELSGPIPPELGNLPNLETLWLAFTELSGPIPPELGNLANLSGLYIGSNQLSGLIPPELGNLSNLQDLYIDHNRLSGPIPPELGKLVNLETLHLGSNELYGRIPPELSKLTNLETLWLAGNQFSGCVPDVLFDVLKNDLSQSGIPSCGVLLNGLTISPGALVPPFDPELTSYTTVVGQSQITISPTYGSNVALQILDQDGSAIPDADSSLAGHQIDLDAGVIIISLRLSTRDGNQTAGHYTIWVNRASAPGAPVIESIAQGGRSLTVAWNPPAETGGAEVASYDLRYIESDAADKSDRNWIIAPKVWTGGPRRYTITELEADTSYDVQVRAVHGAGAGPWSETSVGTPTAVAEACIEPITGSTTIYGAWDSECESTARTGSYARFYTFTLNELRDVAITLQSALDTYLYVREGEGTGGHIVHEDDDDDHSVFTLASSTDSGISESLGSGTYTIEATTFHPGQSGPFTLDVRMDVQNCPDYSESPDLAEKVASGELPSVCDRLPSEPVVISTLGDTGEYGGIVRRFYLGQGDGCSFFRLSRASLVRFSQDGFSLLTSVARDWEMSDDGKEWTFYLREGMKWSDGDDFNADDFIWQYENVILNEELTPTLSAFLRIGDEIGSIEKMDDTTVKFVFPQPNFLFLETVAQADEACYGWNSWKNVPWSPAHYMEQFHIDFNSDANTMAEDAGFKDWTGLFYNKGQASLNPDKPTLAPWKFTNPLGDQVVMSERNPYFWAVDEAGNQLPYLDGIQLTLVENIELGTLMAFQGEIDMQARHIQLDQYTPLKEGEADGGYTLLTWPAFGGSDVVFFFNMSLPGSTGDAIRTKEFRQALSLAIDRGVIQEILFLGFGEIRQSVPPTGHPHYPGDDIAKLRTEYDPDAANALLDEVFPDKDSEGFRLDANGERIVMSMTVTDTYGTWSDAAQVVGRAWEAVGVKTDVNQTTRTLHFTRWETNQWAVMVWNEDTAGFTFNSIGKRTPDGAGSFHGPGCALWLQTGGREDNPDAEGFPCPQESLDLLDMHRRGPGLPEAERNALGKEIYKTIVENQYNIGIVGLSPMVHGVVVKKNTLHNVPDTAANDWILRTPNTAFPEQWYFKPATEPEIPLEALPAAISVGPNHACSLNQNGEISCQGVDDSAQVSGIPTSGGFTVISVGAEHSCAIGESGGVQCWGSDEYGQVSGRPTSGEFIAVGAGARHTCAIDASGSVRCWGSDEHGQSSPPSEGEFVAIGAGDSYTCGLRSDGTLECWGRFDNTDNSSP